MSSAVRRFLFLLRAVIFPLIALTILAVPALRAVDEVDVDPTVAVAYRQGFLPGQFTIVRGGSASAVDVTFHLGGTAVLGTDYTISIDGGPTLSDPSVPSYIAAFAAGVQQVTVTVTPLVTPPGLPEGHVNADLILDPNGSLYSIGGASDASVIIADNSLIATMTVPKPLASDDPALIGLITDPSLVRRGVIEVTLTPPPPLPPAPLSKRRNVEVAVSGSAKLGTKYNLFWKVGGSLVGNGMGWSANYYYPRSTVGNPTTDIGIVLPSGVVISDTNAHALSIPGDPTAYTGVFNNSATSTNTGATAISSITPPLASNLLVGTLVNFDGISGCTVVETGGWSPGSLQVEVSGGFDAGFKVGDVISFTTTTGLYWVITNATLFTVDGVPVWTLSFIPAYISNDATLNFAPNGGLPQPVPLGTVLLTEFPIITTVSDVILPPSSTQVEFSVEPTLGNAPTGAQTVSLTLSQDYDYNMTTPTVGTVTIADAVVQANVTLGTNASQPTTAGSFLVTLSQAFPTAVTVPYTVISNGTNAVPGTDYFPLSGVLTIPSGQTTASIPVTPIATDAILPAGGKDVGVVLSGSLDYKLAGSGTTLTNPSATLNIAPSLGVVGITGSSTVAFMNPSAPGPTTFTVSIARTAGTSQAVIVNYTVGGSAQQGVDFTPLTLSTPTGYATTGSVTIPAGQNSATITINPIEDQTSSGVLQVVLTLTGGQGYTINSTNVSAAVSIQSDTPTLSVVAGTDATQPSTPGTFVISYPGVPAGTVLNHPLTVSYALSGTAKVGTDYANPGTITIPAGTNTITVQITPSNNPLTTDQSVILTLTPASTYAIAANQGTATIALHFVTPPPVSTATTSGSTGATGGGQASYSSSGGGCGVGGGMGLLVVALALSRRRR